MLSNENTTRRGVEGAATLTTDGSAEAWKAAVSDVGDSYMEAVAALEAAVLDVGDS